MDEARGKEEGGGLGQKGLQTYRVDLREYLFISSSLITTSALRLSSLPVKLSDLNFYVFFYPLSPTANHPVSVGNSHLHDSAPKVDNDVRTFLFFLFFCDMKCDYRL